MISSKKQKIRQDTEDKYRGVQEKIDAGRDSSQ